jgi:hypothetical protein
VSIRNIALTIKLALEPYKPRSNACWTGGHFAVPWPTDIMGGDGRRATGDGANRGLHSKSRTTQKGKGLFSPMLDWAGTWEDLGETRPLSKLNPKPRLVPIPATTAESGRQKRTAPISKPAPHEQKARIRTLFSLLPTCPQRNSRLQTPPHRGPTGWSRLSRGYIHTIQRTFIPLHPKPRLPTKQSVRRTWISVETHLRTKACTHIAHHNTRL